MATRPGLSRRRFLRRSLAGAAAAVAAPYVVPGSAVGKGGGVAASERITMGFIGVGHQATGHLLGGAWTYLTGGYVARTDVQVLGICDVRRDRRENTCRRVNAYYAAQARGGAYKACKGYVDLRELLARPDIDAVLIGSPVHWHAMMSILAARAGKDVYVEKPTAVTVRESRATVEAVRRYGRVFQAGTQQRSEYDGKFRRACELVRNGRIGKLKHVWAGHHGGMFHWDARLRPAQPVPDWLDSWDLWLGPAPWRQFDGDLGAHRFGNGGINWCQHYYDVVQWGLGADDTGPVEMTFGEHGLTYRYAGGVEVYAQACPDPAWRFEGGPVFVGTEGRIGVGRNRIAADPPGILAEPLGPGDTPLYRADSHSGNFLECVRTRRATICDVESTHRAASLMILGGIADRLRRPLKWDPAAERFPGDDEANALLSAAKRSPWRV